MNVFQTRKLLEQLIIKLPVEIIRMKALVNQNDGVVIWGFLFVVFLVLYIYYVLMSVYLLYQSEAGKQLLQYEDD